MLVYQRLFIQDFRSGVLCHVGDGISGGNIRPAYFCWVFGRGVVQKSWRYHTFYGNSSVENDDQTTMVSDVQTKQKQHYQHLEHHLEVLDEL